MRRCIRALLTYDNGDYSELSRWSGLGLDDIHEFVDEKCNPVEPQGYWYVSCDGRVLEAETDEDDYNERHIGGHKSIGNYFETKEQAERALKNLKAWKRMSDRGIQMACLEGEE